MQLRAGEWAICGETDMDDRYLCRVIRCEKDTDERNPIVQVRGCIRYPMQHAITDRTIPEERRAVGYGVICRLHVYEKTDRVPGEWADGVRYAIMERMLDCTTKEDRILLRHLHGEYRCKERRLICYKPFELSEKERELLCLL